MRTIRFQRLFRRSNLAFVSAVRWAAVSIVLALTMGCGGPSSVADPPKASTEVANTSAAGTREMWDAVFQGKDRIGHIHTTETPVRNGSENLVHTTQNTQLNMLRYGQEIQLTLRAESTETSDGRLRSFLCRIDASPEPIIAKGQVRSGKLEISTTSGGTTSADTIDWDPSWGGFFAVEQSLQRNPPKPGSRRVLRLLWPGLGGVQVVTVRLEALQRETTKLLDESCELLKVHETIQIGDQSMEMFSWIDADGEMRKSRLPGIDQLVVRTTKQNALAKAAAPSSDLGWSSLVRVAQPLHQPGQTDYAVYLATLPAGDPMRAFVSSGSQIVERVDAHSARITVLAVRPNKPAKIGPNVPPTEADRQPNSLIQSDAPIVIKMAHEVARDQTDPWPVAVALEQHVHQAIRAKNFSQVLATAAHVARSLEGDCTEHAVLLAALCRAREIPAHVVIGLVYVPTKQGFAFHMWNEVWVRERWIPLDATLGHGGIGVGHIKLGESSLARGDVESVFFPVVQVIGQLKLKVVQWGN